MKSEQKQMAFENITTPQELTSYLDNFSRRLQNRSYLYHYTKLPNLIKMLQGKYWHLGNAQTMNDLVEYNNGDPARWNNIFFASFMADAKESIGMWSMYSQPWEKGVKIAIPKQAAKQWVESCTEIFEVSLDDYKLTGRSIPVNQINTIRLSAVAYSNAASLETLEDEEILSCGRQINTNIKRAINIPELTGYIKDNAWDYEKEIRLKAEFNNVYHFKKVAVALSDDVIDSMVITASPLFKGDLLGEIKKEVERTVKIDTSLFAERLNIKPICEDCSYKKKYVNI